MHAENTRPRRPCLKCKATPIHTRSLGNAGNGYKTITTIRCPECSFTRTYSPLAAPVR